MTMRFDNRVVIIIGAGNEVGRSLAVLFAERGASLIINDTNSKAADSIAELIKTRGGKAVPDYNSIHESDKIIARAVAEYGSVHVIVNNVVDVEARKRFQDMGDGDWDKVQETNVFRCYKTARAAWARFKKQKYGRIVNLISSKGPFGSLGNASNNAAEFALVGLTETLGKEGAKNNIISNLVVSRTLNSEASINLAVLLASDKLETNGGIFELNDNSIAKLQWERTKPRGFKIDSSLTPSAILNEWHTIGDFGVLDASPNGAWDSMGLLAEAANMPSSAQGRPVDFKGKVAVITGAGNGLGRQYALQLAALGARIIVNDLANPQAVVDEIKASGGEAVADKHSVEDGDKIIQTALDNFGGIHILVNNAGILRDKSFQAMTDDMWNIIQAVHLRGTYKTLHAAWPIFQKQGFGRIVNTTSVSGIYGNFGQSNYAAAKCAIVGLSAALAIEGKGHNIRVNTIAPSAGTQLTRTVMPEEIVQALKPDYVAPFVIALLSDSDTSPEIGTGGLYEIGSGFIAADRFQRTQEHKFPTSPEITLESMVSAWPSLTKPAPIDYLKRIKEAKAKNKNGIHYEFTTKDVILYNLGLQAKSTDLNLIYENSPHFEVLPTFGVIPSFDPSSPSRLQNLIPNFSMTRLLHGEQYLEIRKFPTPTSGKLVTWPSLLEVVDKGKAAIVVNGYKTVLESTGEDVFYCESTVFVRGSGQFGGQKTGADRGAATAANKPPPRKPDATVIENISPDAAALYRLSGDTNPLHVDPEVAKAGGLDAPILHGLCSFGISAKHIYTTYGPFKNIKARFNSTVLPGQTLQTDMWKEKGKVIFTTTVVETKKVALASAAVELLNGTPNL